MKFDSLKTRQVKSGAYMTVYVLIAFAILAAVNFLAVQYNKSYDSTKDKLYSLSDQTLKVLHNLDRDVKIYYFDKKTQFQRARDMLTRYSNATTKVSIEYIDPDSRPEVAQAMNVRTYGTVFVEMGPTREEAKTTNEEDVTNAIIKAIKGKEKTACLLGGHGEAAPDDAERDGFASAKKEIEGANYATKAISLLQEPEVPSDCTILIVAGPDKEYLQPEIDILRKYIEGGGRALFMIDYQKSPRLVELLASWGVKVNDDVVVDLSGIGQLFGGGPLAPLVAQYENHPIADGMGNVATLFPMTRSVEPGETPPAHWHDTKLFSTTAKSFATSALKVNDGELIRNPAKERQGPIPVGVAATYDVPESDSSAKAADAEKKDGEKAEIKADKEKNPLDSDKKEGRIVVLGTSRLARNNFLGVGGNLDLFLNTLNWLSSDEDLISIRPKQPDNTPLDVSAGAMQRILLGTVFGLPLMIIVAGIRVWWIRRA
jgi:gliding motility-associatede transport system auxiliary component